MLRYLLIAVTSAAASSLFSVPAAAQGKCGPRADIVTELSRLFQEAPNAVGQVNGNAVIEVFVSDKGTWTIIATSADGKSCVLSAGDGWESTTFVVGKTS
jgi:hypothetical protein